jgi:hypothetical protein
VYLQGGFGQLLLELPPPPQPIIVNENKKINMDAMLTLDIFML